MAIPKNLQQAKSWVRNRGKGRPRADELKRVIQLFGGKRNYDLYVAKIKAEKASVAKKAKTKPGRRRKKTNAKPSKLLITRGEKIPTNRTEAEHWVRTRPPGRPKRATLDAVIKIFGGRKQYDDFRAKVKLQQQGKLPTPKTKRRRRPSQKRIERQEQLKEEKKARAKAEAKREKFRSARQKAEEEIKEVIYQGHYVVFDPHSNTVKAKMLATESKGLVKIKLYYTNVHSKHSYIHLRPLVGEPSGYQIRGPQNSIKIVSPSAFYPFSATIYSVDESLLNYKEPEFWTDAEGLHTMFQAIDKYLERFGVPVKVLIKGPDSETVNTWTPGQETWGVAQLDKAETGAFFDEDEDDIFLD